LTVTLTDALWILNKNFKNFKKERGGFPKLQNINSSNSIDWKTGNVKIIK